MPPFVLIVLFFEESLPASVVLGQPGLIFPLY